MDTNFPSPQMLDLDALAPKAAVIKFQDQEIAVQPLDLPDYVLINQIRDDLLALQTSEAPDNIEAYVPIYLKFTEFAKRLLPELADKKIGFFQLLGLINFLIEATQPTDKTMEELKKRGIDFKPQGGGSDGPKGDLTSSEPLPSSSEVTQPTEPTTSPAAE